MNNLMILIEDEDVYQVGEDIIENTFDNAEQATKFIIDMLTNSG